MAAREGWTGLSMVCCTRGAVDALDVVDWDALFQLSTRQAKRRLLFGTNTRQRRRRRAADVFWLWDDGLQQLQRRSWSRGLEPRQSEAATCGPRRRGLVSGADDGGNSSTRAPRDPRQGPKRR